MTPEQYPTFVRFKDLNDPKTIENVRQPDDIKTSEIKKEDPRRPIIDFKKTFGFGIDIKKVTFEITSDPVTWGIEKYLPWVLTVGGGNLGGGRFSGPEWYERLSKSQFKGGQQ